MQILIELSKEDLDDIKNNDYIDGTYYTMLDAIINGIPIPKGHGDLIDVNEVIKIANKTKDLHGAIWNASTIIEDDKEYEVEIITRGNCMMCGKKLNEGLFFCKECEAKTESEG